MTLYCCISLNTLAITVAMSFYSGSTRSHKPSFGISTEVLLEYSNGLAVSEQILMRNLLNIVARPTLDCIIPKRSPMQILGPSPNGIKVQICLLATSFW